MEGAALRALMHHVLHHLSPLALLPNAKGVEGDTGSAPCLRTDTGLAPSDAAALQLLPRRAGNPHDRSTCACVELQVHADN